MAAVWNSSPGGKGNKTTEKAERELKRLRFDVKQYDSQLKKLQREVALKTAELKKLRSCGACTCLGDRRRNQSHGSQRAEVRDLGTIGNGPSRDIASKARLEIHGQRPASVAECRRRDQSAGREARQTPAPALRRSRTEFFKSRIHDGEADTSAALSDRDRELARLHQELAQLRAENLALSGGATKGILQSRNLDDNARTLRELGRQVRELENELLQLRQDRCRLLAESEQLRTDLNSKETNLLRCETQLSKTEREKIELVKQVGRLESKERLFTSKPRSPTRERLLAEKDHEISKLKATIRDLEHSYGTFRKNFSDEEANLRLQRQLSSAIAAKSKAEQGRVLLESDFKQLQRQYQKLSQDKADMQREWELCIEEQDKQKRQLHRYLNDVQTYERLVAEKDREISKLKATIRDLEQDYAVFRKNLNEQETNLLRLQRDLSIANAMKDKTEQGRVVLADDYKRLQQQYQKLHQDKATMQRELEMCVEEQDKQKRLLQQYLDDIQTYERLLAEKEKERMDMLLQFQASAERACKCGNSPPRA